MATQQAPLLVNIGQASTAELVGYSINLCFAVLVFPFALWKQCTRGKPYISRGIFGIVNIISRIVISLGYLIPLSPYQAVGCHLRIFLFNIVIIAISLLFAFQMFRFLLLRLVTYSKQRFGDSSTNDVNEDAVEMDLKGINPSEQERLASAIQMSSQSASFSLVIRTLGAFISTFSQILFIIVIAIIYYVVTIGKYFAAEDSSQRCALLFEQSQQPVVLVVVISMGLAFVGVVIDFFSYAKHFFLCRLYKVYVQDDPNLFRLEMIFFCLGNLVLVVLTLIALFVPMPSTVSSGISDVSLFLWSNYILILAPCFSLSITYYKDISLWWMQRKFADAANKGVTEVIDISKYTPSIDMIEMLLKTPATFELFNKFAINEFNVENILCWKDMQLYKTFKTQTTRLKHATKLYDTFLKSGALLEVNVPKTQTDVVKTAISSFHVKTSPLPETLFNTVESTVMVNMLDMYNRFFTSSSFQSFLNKMKV